MNASAITALVLIGGFVWGGFLVLLIHGIRHERRKTREGAEC